MKVLLVCSTGGHLTHLVRLRRWWQEHERHWVTFDKADARSLLAGESVSSAHHPTTRSLRALALNSLLALRVMWRERPDVVVSSGAGVALPFFVLARLTGVRTVYLEVYDRIDSPTLTGRLCRPLSDLFVLQWPEQLAVYPGGRVVGQLFGGQQVGRAAGASSDREGGRGPVRLVVSLGTDHHRFDRVLAWLSGWLATTTAEVDVFVQHGSTPLPSGLAGTDLMPPEELRCRFVEADVVLVQAGPGSIMDVRACGRVPIAVPRLARLDEVVDDHQVAFVRRMHQEGLVRAATTERELRDLLDAAVADPGHLWITPDDPEPVAVVRRFGEWVEDVVRAGPRRRARRRRRLPSALAAGGTSSPRAAQRDQP